MSGWIVGLLFVQVFTSCSQTVELTNSAQTPGEMLRDRLAKTWTITWQNETLSQALQKWADQERLPLWLKTDVNRSASIQGAMTRTPTIRLLDRMCQVANARIVVLLGTMVVVPQAEAEQIAAQIHHHRANLSRWPNSQQKLFLQPQTLLKDSVTTISLSEYQQAMQKLGWQLQVTDSKQIELPTSIVYQPTAIPWFDLLVLLAIENQMQLSMDWRTKTLTLLPETAAPSASVTTLRMTWPIPDKMDRRPQSSWLTALQQEFPRLQLRLRGKSFQATGSALELQELDSYYRLSQPGRATHAEPDQLTLRLPPPGQPSMALPAAAQKRHSLQQNNITLRDYAQLLQQHWSAQVKIDEDALFLMGKSELDRLNISLLDCTLAEALERILKPIGISYHIRVERNVVLVTIPAPN